MHVSDASSLTAPEQDAQVELVLRELGAEGKPRLHVINKVDLLPVQERELLRENANTVHVSALKGIGLSSLLDKMDQLLAHDPISRVFLKVPQSEGKMLAQVESKTKILSREFRGEEVHLEVQGPQSYLRELERFRVRATKGKR